MKAAIMQPYLFPYIGYYQLAMSADIFIFYDDVSFIKQGYINRNTILTKNGAQRFTLPVLNASSNAFIKDLFFDNNVKKLLATLSQAYSSAPEYHKVFPVIEQILIEKNRSITHICSQSITGIIDYLGLEIKFSKSSSIDYERSGSATEKIISICKATGADTYINSPGGKDLYHHEEFARHGIDLQFIQPQAPKYTQGNQAFVANLSIIDPLMWCSREQVIDMLDHYTLARE